MKLINVQGWALPVVLLAVLAAEGRTQTAQPEYTLMVNGQTGSAKVVHINGHSFVDLDALARIANGSVAYQGNQITLMLPRVDGQAVANVPEHVQPNNGFSKEFLQAGIEYMSEIREWRNTLLNTIANGYPLSDDLFVGYRGQAATSLRLAKVAASTQGDKSAAQLLSNEYDDMQNLTKKYVDKRARLEFVDPNSMDSDPMNQKILACARSLATMATNNQFADDGACHWEEEKPKPIVGNQQSERQHLLAIRAAFFDVPLW